VFQYFKKTKRASALFVGHGNPMNAILQNDFTASLNKLGQTLKRPKAILVISAHWFVAYNAISIHKMNELLYDMYGFPNELYKVQYSAPNAKLIFPLITEIFPDITVLNRGLDHGSWSILKHIYPTADIPVMQFAINSQKTLREHFEIGRKLAVLREHGVMIIGSGNITHNLAKADLMHQNVPLAPWAEEFDNFVKEAIEKRDFNALIEFENKAPHARLAHPTLEHYIPLLYIAGTSYKNDMSIFPYVGVEHKSISMRSWLLQKDGLC